jgi:glycosyltransferase involved in cell wall biosynthesis
MTITKQSGSRKLQAVHVATDCVQGGVQANIEGLNTSRLAETIDFSFQLLNEQKLISPALPFDFAIFHAACSWVNLPRLFKLKQLGRVILLEHHYGRFFDDLVPDRRRFHLMLRIAYSLVDQVVAISCNQAEWMLENRLVKPQKLTLIQQARDLHTFLAIPECSPSYPLILGAYGRLSPEKGFDVLIGALRQLPSIPVRVLLGGDGPERERLQTLAAGLNNLEFVGRVEDVPDFLERCDVVLVPSRRETWGYACMEAKAAARPVIASEVGGLSEQIRGCGLLVPADNPTALGISIQQLCALPLECLQAWGRQGRYSVQGAWERYLEQWESLIDQFTI